MSHHDKEERDKKRKKRLADVLFHLHAGRLNAKIDVGTPDTSKKGGGERREAAKSLDTADCAEKLATVHKSLALRKREATDRWNRFAGTSGGGGRGR